MYNTIYFTIALEFLKAIMGQLSSQLQSDIQSGRTTLNPQVLELKKEISGGGTIDLIDANTNRVDGICSFDKNILQTGRAVIFDQISFGYKSDAASGKEGSLSYNSAAPAALLNSLVIITQSGREALRLPFADLHNLASGQNTADQYTQAKALCYLVDDKNIEIRLKFAPGVVLDPATKHYVYLRLNGVQTTVKAGQ
jgi:hypothetical protein